jgi:predicted nuclease with TOPRIM domain
VAGGAVYAYSSPSVTEETSLFVIKNSLETIEERLQRTPERRARFYLKKLERREAESEVLRQRHRALEGTENRIKKIENQLERMQGELEYVGSNDIVLKDKIKLRLEYRKNRLHQPEVRAGRTHPSW